MKTKLLLMLLAVMLTAGLAQANMIANPGFEEEVYDIERERVHPMPWLSQYSSMPQMSWMDDSAEAHSGDKYWKIWNFQSQGDTYSTYIVQGPIDVVEGKEYAFSVWAKCLPEDEPVQALASCQWVDSNDDDIDNGFLWLDGATDIEDEWYYVDLGSLTAPAGAEGCEFSLWSGTGNKAKRVLFDDADMRIASITDADPPGGTRFKDSYPAEGVLDEVILTWTNMEPNSLAPDPNVYVDVWFGYEPNNIPTAGWTKIIDANTPAGLGATTYTVTAPTTNAPAPTPYYWKVVSYPNGAANIDPNNNIEGPTLEFTALSEQPAEVEIHTNDIVTWLGETISLDVTVTDDGDSPVTLLWEVVDVNGGIAFDPNQYVEDPNISFIPGTYVNALIKSPSFEDGLNGWDDYGSGGSGETWSGAYSYEGSLTVYAVPTDGDSLLTAYSDANEDTGVSQTLIETLAADTDYELTVDVCLTNYYKETLALYRVQLLAGETVLAEDHNGYYLDIPGKWETSTVTHTSGPPTDPNVGQQLTIRLLAVDEGDSITCDNVQLTSDPPFPVVSGHIFTLKFTATDAVGSDSDKMTVQVYDNACHAGRGAFDLAKDNLGDIASDPEGPFMGEPDCLTNIYDVAAMTTTWLDNTELTTAETPVSKGTSSGGSDGVISLFNDPGFQTPAFGNGKYSYAGGISGSPWTFTGGSGLSDPNGPWGCKIPSPDPAGPQFAFLQNACTISQTITGLTIGETYSFSFFEAARGTSTPYPSDNRNDLSVILDDDLPENVIYNNNEVENVIWWEYQTTESFVATKTSYLVTFKASNPRSETDCTTIIDGLGAVDPNAPYINTGEDMIILSGDTISLDADIVEKDPTDWTNLTLEWTAVPADDVVFDPNRFVEDPTVTITAVGDPNTGDPNSVRFTLSVSSEAKPLPARDTMMVDVYSNACLAQVAANPDHVFDTTDFTLDCSTGIADLAILAEKYLVDYTPDSDYTVPEPNPMTFAVVPDANNSDSSITMVATTASDTENDVEYYFTCTNGGGHDSGWQTGTSYTDPNLLHETEYTYTVKARDTGSNKNTTDPSEALSATTEADKTAPTPDPMTWATVPAAGTVPPGISYVQITSDDNSGISSSNTYTHAIDFGNEGAATVNTVVFSDDIGTAAGGRSNSGSRTYGTNPTAGNTPPSVSGDIADVFTDLRYWHEPGDIELTGLTPGQWYDVRLYDRSYTYPSTRIHTAEYDVDSDGSAEFTTPEINTGNPTLPPVSLSGAASWATSYVYQAGSTGKIKIYFDFTPGQAYQLYGLTNHEIEVGPFDTAICMVATTAIDQSGVQYRFFETSENPGGSNSVWQDSPFYVDTGLTSGTTYTYKVRARDKSADKFATAFSTEESATTD
jgi:hypothetical protein